MPAAEVPHFVWELILAVKEKNTTAASTKLDVIKHIGRELEAYYEVRGYDARKELEKARPEVLKKKSLVEAAEIRKEERQIARSKLAASAEELRERLELYTEAEYVVNRAVVGNDWVQHGERVKRKDYHGQELDRQLEELQALRKKLEN